MQVSFFYSSSQISTLKGKSAHGLWLHSLHLFSLQKSKSCECQKCGETMVLPDEYLFFQNSSWLLLLGNLYGLRIVQYCQYYKNVPPNSHVKLFGVLLKFKRAIFDPFFFHVNLPGHYLFLKYFQGVLLCLR